MSPSQATSDASAVRSAKHNIRSSMDPTTEQPVLAETPWYVWATLAAAGGYVIWQMMNASENPMDEEED